MNLIESWMITHMLLSMIWMFITVFFFGNHYGMMGSQICFTEKKDAILFFIVGICGCIALIPISIWLCR